MNTNLLFRNIARTLFVLVIIGAAKPVFAATASELFADGNRLFRDDLYWAALLRYREASEAGMDTPLLHYNAGVAHYKASQHIRARESLRKATTYAPLVPLAHYNLGLNAYALGDYDEALGWFRRAANQEQRRDIARLARQAIRQLEGERDSTDPVMVVQAGSLDREYEFTNLDFRVRSGIGFDDNLFRTPAGPYVDRSDPANPIVVPEAYSGPYVPFSLRARYQVNALENEGFFGSYRFGGRFFSDPHLNNADEYLQEIAVGSEYGSRTEERETRVYSAFKIAQHDENYYYTDNGYERTASGADISDRMNYLRYGPEFWARKRFGSYTFGFRAVGRLYNYEEIEVVPEYDYEYWLTGLHSQVRLSQTSLLQVNADYYTRRFGDRPSFELDGSQPVGTPTVRYDYVRLSVEARQRITRAMWFSLGYARTNRKDQHVGYNSYGLDEYSARFNLRLGDRFTMRFVGRYFNYNYENAFAFHEPTAGLKTMERIVGSLIASFEMTESLDLVAEYRYRETASSDARLAYNQSQSMLAIRWSP